MKTVKIDSAWQSLRAQRVTDDEGNFWTVPDILDAARGLEVMDLPLIHLSIDFNIGSMKARDFLSHMKNVMDSDLGYPIILDQDGCVFDGKHRVIKALYEERETIKAIRLDEDPSPTGKEKLSRGE